LIYIKIEGINARIGSMIRDGVEYLGDISNKMGFICFNHFELISFVNYCSTGHLKTIYSQEGRYLPYWKNNTNGTENQYKEQQSSLKNTPIGNKRTKFCQTYLGYSIKQRIKNISFRLKTGKMGRKM